MTAIKNCDTRWAGYSSQQNFAIQICIVPLIRRPRLLQLSVNGQLLDFLFGNLWIAVCFGDPIERIQRMSDGHRPRVPVVDAGKNIDWETGRPMDVK